MTRQEAIWWVNHLFGIRKEEYFNKGMLQDAREVDEARQIVIYALQTEVVRCKDCRFYLQSNEKCELVDTRLHFYETDKTWAGDCYCSWGERREP